MSLHENGDLVEENTAAVRRLADEGFKRRNLDAVDEFIAAAMIDHNPMPGQQPGPAGVKDFINMLYAAFPMFDLPTSTSSAAVIWSPTTGTWKGRTRVHIWAFRRRAGRSKWKGSRFFGWPADRSLSAGRRSTASA